MFFPESLGQNWGSALYVTKYSTCTSGPLHLLLLLPGSSANSFSPILTWLAPPHHSGLSYNVISSRKIPMNTVVEVASHPQFCVSLLAKCLAEGKNEPNTAETDRSLFVSRIKTPRVAVPEVSPGTHTLPLYSATLNILTFSLAMITSRSPDKSCTSGHMSVSQTRRRAAAKGQSLPLDAASCWAGYSSWTHARPGGEGCWGHKHFILSALATENAREKGGGDDLGQLVSVIFTSCCCLILRRTYDDLK